MPSVANVGDYPIQTITGAYGDTSGTYWKYNYAQTPLDTFIMPYNEVIKQERSDNMRFLYYVILVNPKNDDFFTLKVVAKSETSALMEAYNKSHFQGIKFDDLITNCKCIMEWKKKDSLEKAIETIKKAVE